MYRVIRGLRVYTYHYIEIYFKILSFINEIAEYYDIQIKNVRHYHIKNYCIDVLQYDIAYSTKKGSIAGLTLISEQLVAIVINANKNVHKERQTFSLMHEIAHTILHIDENSETQQFASVRNSLNHYENNEKIEQEIEADICASILMINDDALIEQLKKKKTFEELKQIFNTSHSATQTRLTNFLIYTASYPYQKARELLSSYMQGEISLETIFPDCLIDDCYLDSYY